jgi:hypothetical protein
VGLKGQPPIVSGDFHKRIIVDDSVWTLEDGSTVALSLQKDNKMEWWKCVLVGDPEINTQKVWGVSVMKCVWQLGLSKLSYGYLIEQR